MTETNGNSGETVRPAFDVHWFVMCAAITAVGLFLRALWLGLRPLHHDEGVNGWFLTNLVRDGLYKYDPANYHGPTLYYIARFFTGAFGLNTLAIRWSVVVWGVLAIVLVFYLRDVLGRAPTLASALLLALSPGLIFISRYFIHETFFVFLGLGLVVAIVLFITKENAGRGAIAWFAVLLFTSLAPPGISAAGVIAGEGGATLWLLRIAFVLIAVGVSYWVTRVAASWRNGRPIYLLLASACVALMLATKETALITLGTMVTACVCIVGRDAIRRCARENTFPWRPFLIACAGSIAAALVLNSRMPEVAADFAKRTSMFFGMNPDRFSALFYVLIVIIPAGLVAALFALDRAAKREVSEGAALSLFRFRIAAGEGTDRLRIGVGVAVIAVLLLVIYFSSFFTHWEGVIDFFRAYTFWVKTGSKDHTQNGFWAYLSWGFQSDGPLFVLAAIGTAIALVKGDRRFPIFAALWAVGLFAAYTIIPYKTPWLAVSFLLPMCLIGGYGAAELFTSANKAVQTAGLGVAAAAIAILVYQSYDLNFVRYDDEDAPMVYAHTQREFLDMVADIERFAALSGKGKDASIDILSPDYWPLVWYMRDYPKAIFHGRFITNSNAEVLVIKKGEQDNEAIRTYSSRYSYYKSYKLRSGVELALLVRNDLARGEGEQLYRIGGDR